MINGESSAVRRYFVVVSPNNTSPPRTVSRYRLMCVLTIFVITTIIAFMVSKLHGELKMSKPFRSLEEEALLNIVRTAEHVANKAAAVIKPFDLTATQYNVLRILRGASEQGISCGEITGRMVTKDSDITRLLDRLENRGLISRERPENNRRTVISRITDAGLELLAQLDAPIDESNKSLMGHLGKKNLETLNELLAAVRTAE
jgi:DNA-binding MarR family transcriptional regulator